MGRLHPLDIAVLVGYVLGVLSITVWFVRRSNNTGAFMAADRALPGWAVGLSIFGSYISSISFLANPGKSYGDNWNAFVFNLTTPLAALVAVYWFVPFYRRRGHISAYEHLEHRFGPWARTYAVVCFLLTQVGRMGVIVYLLAIAVEPLTGLPIPATVVILGLLMIAVALIGGIKAVVWTGVAQSCILLLGVAICLAAVIQAQPHGAAAAMAVAADEGKLGLGSLQWDFAASTFWVVLLFGLTSNLQNFGIDQSYVQRYITARSDRAAVRSVWIGAWLYVPTGAAFFLIGTLLHTLYAAQPADLPDGLAADSVFPHYIATHLAAGLRGLVIAALIAAATDSNLNNMATLTLCDVYKRYLRPAAGQGESMWVLRLSTLGWGVLGTAMGLAMIGVKSVLAAWWEWASIFSGGMLGLFLLGLISRRAGSRAAATAVIVGVLVIIWMSLSTRAGWPRAWDSLRSPFHSSMIIVIGTATILVVGVLAGWASRGTRSNSSTESGRETS